MKWVVQIAAAGTTTFAILYLLHIYEKFDVFFFPEAYQALFTGLILALVFLLVPASKKAPRDKLPWYDAVLALAIFGGCLYPALFYRDIAMRAAYATSFEVPLGIAVILLMLEATRRTTGWALVIIAVLFLVYARYTGYFPGLLEGIGHPLPRVIGSTYLFEGIFGMIMQVIASIVLVYLFFAQLLFACGAGDFLTDLALSIVGKYSGGPAKGVVVADVLFGTISGSAVASVVTTGSVTIPLMKSTGYKPHYAAAIEAVSSTGGALMPPVMGIVAFIMADFLKISYAQVCVAAALPAVLYYLAIYAQVHYQARKLGLVGLPREQLPRLGPTIMRGWHFFIPLFVLIYCLILLRYDPVKAGFYASGAAILASWLRKETRIGPKRMFESLEQTALTLINIVPACGAAGVIISSVSITGMGLRLSSILIKIAAGNVAILLVVTAVACVIMSMGLPWTACYIILALLVAPALANMGIRPIAAHLFLLYMGLISFITPPVCIAVYAACPIAGSEIWPTGIQAVRLGIVAYLIPFVFVFQPTLLLMGPPILVVLMMITSVLGVIALASALEGYFATRAGWLERVLWGAGAIGLFIQGWSTNITGILLVAVAAMLNLRKVERAKELQFRNRELKVETG